MLEPPGTLSQESPDRYNLFQYYSTTTPERSGMEPFTKTLRGFSEGLPHILGKLDSGCLCGLDIQWGCHNGAGFPSLSGNDGILEKGRPDGST